jgi:hypothetical protein
MYIHSPQKVQQSQSVSVDRKMFRQGDVLLVEVRSIPPNARLVEPEGDHVILVRGEKTGHHHGFSIWDRVSFFRDDGTGNGYTSVMTNSADLIHQEHKPIPVPFGMYRVIQQREFKPKRFQMVED